MTWKRALKIERIARLSADPAGYNNDQIANMLNCTPQTIVIITADTGVSCEDDRDREWSCITI